MSYAMVGAQNRRARPYAGLGITLPSFTKGIVSGGTPEAATDLAAALGDWATNPVVIYMVATMPAALRAVTSEPPTRDPQGLVTLINAFKLALLAMQYQGQSAVVLNSAALAVAAQAASNAYESQALTNDYSTDTLLLAEELYNNQLHPVAAAVAALPKAAPAPTPPAQAIKLNFGAVGAALVACVKAGGTYKNTTPTGSPTCTTTRPGVHWDPTKNAFVANAAAPLPASNTALYVGGGAAVLGLAALFLL